MKTIKTVLLTGATGFIGRETAKALSEAGWQVTQGSRHATQSQTERVVSLDLSEPTILLNLAKEYQFDAIVHLGAQVGLTDETELQLFTSNVLSTGCLAYLAHLWGAYLVFTSTAIVHGVRAEIIGVDSPLCPDTPYGKSKLLAEQLISASQIHHCILRIAGVFGANGPSHLGLNRAIDAALKGEPPLQVGSGLALRNYIYVKDVADTLVYVLQEQLEGTYLLAGKETLSINAMLQKLCETFVPNQRIVIREGVEAKNQVIVPSCQLPRSRSFCEALNDLLTCTR